MNRFIAPAVMLGAYGLTMLTIVLLDNSDERLVDDVCDVDIEREDGMPVNVKMKYNKKKGG